MKFYSGKDGIEIMNLIIQGKTVEEAVEIVNPEEVEIKVSKEVEEFCEELDKE